MRVPRLSRRAARLGAAAVLLLTLALGLAACGGGGGGGGGNNASPSQWGALVWGQGNWTP